jgi:hypothetical protein
VEHFDNAIKMGEHAAGAMLGSGRAVRRPALVLVGSVRLRDPDGGVRLTDDMVLRGSLEERRFCAFFLTRRGPTSEREHRLASRRAQVTPLIRREVAPDRAALSDPAIDLRTLDPARA